MAAQWANLTESQALLLAATILAGLWRVFPFYDVIRDVVRRRRGDPLGDHCDNCAVVDRLDEQLSRLVYFAHDRHSELERIRQAAEQVADRDEGGLRGYLEASGRHVTIERVLDGDTIAVNPGDERIRLLTIDAAERHVATHGSADCGADDAWHALPGLLPASAEVIVNGLKGEPATDRCA